VTVDSAVGEGTTFEVMLPIDEDAARARTEAAATPALRRGTETILLVEDEPGVRMLTRVVLERQGYRVLEAAHGLEAVRLWDQHQAAIRLLLTDIVMPEGVNGRELAGRFRAANPTLPVIFTSGYSADIAGREFALQEGQNFLQKPFSPRQLLEIVDRSLAR
jgi:CheY-like chemotaxis protein